MPRNYDQYVEKLQGEYLESFKKIELYFNSSELFDCDVEETMNEILDMLLMAQSENKPVDKVIGKDMKKFCTNYVKESYSNSTAKITFATSLCFLLLVYLLCAGEALCKYFLHETNNIWTGAYDTGAVTLGLMSGIFAGFIIDVIAKNTVFKLGAKRTKRFKRFVWIFAGVLACTVIGIKESLGFRFDISLRSITFLVVYVVMIIVAFYVIHELTSEASDEEEYREKKVNYIKKQFIKENEKRRNKGKDEISSREFIEKKIKDQVISKYIVPVMLAVLICEILYFLFVKGLHSIFTVSSVILIFILLAAALFMLEYILKLKDNKEIIETLKEQNIETEEI